MTTLLIKLFIGLVLFGSWIALVWFKVQGTEAIIEFIHNALIGLGAYHLADRNPKSTAQDGQTSK